MLSISDTILYYKNQNISKLISLSCKNREVGVKYLEGYFGKRPEIIENPADVLEFSKNRSSSFHISEEIWSNPLAISTGQKQSELDELRIGWDLIIDIDFPVWDITKLIANEIIIALKKHGVKSITIKFSGNKGFHIGVPFKAFPDSVHGKDTKLLFPEGVKRINAYLVHYIDKLETGFEFSQKILANPEFQKYASENEGKKLIYEVCKKCGTRVTGKDEKKVTFQCSSCGNEISDGDGPYKICPVCSRIMKRVEVVYEKICPKCSSREAIKKVNLLIDEILVSSRHLYRCPYSLHEKSGLVSLPINPDDVLSFKRESAEPKKVLELIDFILKNKELISYGPNEAQNSQLLNKRCGNQNENQSSSLSNSSSDSKTIASSSSNPLSSSLPNWPLHHKLNQSDPSDPSEQLAILRENHLIFLDDSKIDSSEGKTLITEAFDYNPDLDQSRYSYHQSHMDIPSRRDNFEGANSGDSTTQSEYKPLVISLEGTNLDIDSFADKYFPPCIRLGLKGLSDGRKRFLFIFVNFLKSIGWNSKDIIDAVHKWNSRNKEPLSSQMIDSHLKYHLSKKGKTAPPNCISKGYYTDFGICKPDETCSLVKNPLNYAQLMLKRTKGEEKKARKPKGIRKSKETSTNNSAKEYEKNSVVEQDNAS